MRDLPVEQFQEALRVAVQSQNEGGSAAADKPGLHQAAEVAPQNVTFQDANNRSLEYQVMQMTRNSMMQSFALELIRFQLNSLQSVISERP